MSSFLPQVVNFISQMIEMCSLVNVQSGVYLSVAQRSCEIHVSAAF